MRTCELCKGRDDTPSSTDATLFPLGLLAASSRAGPPGTVSLLDAAPLEMDVGLLEMGVAMPEVGFALGLALKL